MKRLLPLLFAFLWLQYGVLAPRTQAEDEAIAVIVNPTMRAGTLSADQLVAVFTLSKRAWDGGQAAIPFNYEAGSPLRDAFDRTVLGMNPDAIARFWIDRRIRGMGDAPRKVPSIALMLRVIAKLPGAIGYVPASTVTREVKVVALIKNGQILPPASATVGAP